MYNGRIFHELNKLIQRAYSVKRWFDHNDSFRPMSSKGVKRDKKLLIAELGIPKEEQLEGITYISRKKFFNESSFITSDPFQITFQGSSHGVYGEVNDDFGDEIYSKFLNQEVIKKYGGQKLIKYIMESARSRLDTKARLFYRFYKGEITESQLVEYIEKEFFE